ncbi:myb-related transcription factor, partner of profilin [Clupea harengus]|uniref:Myb-related transcription factor, partner of profilin n=1 Tax=Clupea harengus TaxID=7950 RepID=A0A6P8FT65_CLUHA|nr:myb-related transcription factor, partner of profilin [Clupea harengus]
MSGYPYIRTGRGGAGGVRFKRRKSRFSFEEVQLMLNEVRRNRHILVGKFNRGVSSDIKKRTWASITARINEISECPREILEIIKKWSDLKCDTKRKVAAMRASGASSARVARDLSPIEAMVHQILQMPTPGSADAQPYGGPFGEGDEGDDDSMGPLLPPPLPPTTSNGRMLLPAPPPPLAPGVMHGPPAAVPTKTDLGLPIDMMYTRNSPHPLTDFQFEAPDIEDSLIKFDDGQPGRERGAVILDAATGLLSDLERPRPDSNPRGLGGGSFAAPSTPSVSAPSPPVPPPPRPGSAATAMPPQQSGLLQEQLAQSATLSLQEQQAATALMGSISRSLEAMSESVQQLVETQQTFVRDSLQLQRDALHVLRDFTAGALTLMQDKLNGRPLLP